MVETRSACFDEFTRRYQAELTDPERAAALAHLRELTHRKKRHTLLTATKDIDISEADVLAKLVLSRRVRAHN
jgi:uncharacterized protein YeaO (DUF488 family)